MASWFVTLAGTELGPLTDAQLRQLAREGKLRGDDMVRKKGVAEPIAAGRIQGLFPVAVQAPHVTQSPVPATQPPAAPALPPVRGTFAEWYGGTVGRWFIPLQILAWLFAGYFWIPAWWGFSLLNSTNPKLVTKGRWVLAAVVCSFLVWMMFTSRQRGIDRSRAERRLKDREQSTEVLSKIPKGVRIPSLTFNEFRSRVVGKTFKESDFLEEYGPPAKTFSTADVSSPMAKKMFATDMVHVGYLCKDEAAVVQYLKNVGEITVIAVIKAKDITLVPPSSWKHLEYD